MEQHCGNSDYESDIPAVLSLPEVNGQYGLNNLFCVWNITNTEVDKFIYMKFLNMVRNNPLYRTKP
jgi:hypothetical protein